jgi:hypothetical protein
MATLKLKAGDDRALRFTVKKAGVAVNLYGGTLTFKIAKNILVSDAEATYFHTMTTFTDAANGIHDETISKLDSITWPSGNYFYQARFTDYNGIIQSDKVEVCLIEATLFD